MCHTESLSLCAFVVAKSVLGVVLRLGFVCDVLLPVLSLGFCEQIDVPCSCDSVVQFCLRGGPVPSLFSVSVLCSAASGFSHVWSTVVVQFCKSRLLIGMQPANALEIRS